MSLISEELVLFESDAASRDEAIAQMAQAMDAAGRIANVDQYIADVKAREEESSTAIGFDYATPHAKSEGVSQAALGFTRFVNPIQWSEVSDPVRFAFQIAAPTNGEGDHLEILAKIFRKLMHEDFRESLANAQTKAEVVEIVNAI